MPFQVATNYQPAVAVPGDFATAAPYASVPAVGGAFVSGPNGLTIGRFAWIDPSGTFANNYGTGAPNGFVHRKQRSYITTFLAESSMVVPAGMEIDLADSGDWWAVSSTVTVIGQKVYANYATGAISTGAPGTPPTGGVVTASIAANATNTFTGVIATQSNILTASAVTGFIAVGAVLSGTGVTSGTTVVAQLSGAAGGVGTYQVSILQTVASTTITGTYGVLTATAVSSGTLAVGDVLSGTSVTAGTIITALGTGVGGIGTYYVSQPTVVTSTAVTATGAAETKWYARSANNAGELFILSTRPAS